MIKRDSWPIKNICFPTAADLFQQILISKIQNQLQTHKSSIKTQRKHKMAPNHSHISHSNYRQNKAKQMLKSFAHVKDTVKLEKNDTK